MKRSSIERIRVGLGRLLQEWFERSMEFALACATLINARATMIQNADGRWWALILCSIGSFHLVIVLRSLVLGMTQDRDCWRSRAIAAGLQAVMYIVVSVAVVTGPTPKQAGERYYLSAWMMFWVCVYLTSKAVPRKGVERG